MEDAVIALGVGCFLFAPPLLLLFCSWLIAALGDPQDK
jgi:hypothetical protein